MGLSLLDKAFWLTGLVGQIVLLAILVSRKRSSRFPVFTAWVAFDVAQSIINFAVYRFGSPAMYFWSYWGGAGIDVLLQLALVFEMAREVFGPTGRWVRGARKTFLIAGLIGAFLAVTLSFAVDPKLPTNLFAWSIRLELFTSLLIAELVSAMFVAAQKVGLQWQSWVIGLGQGLVAWICVSVAVDMAHSYWGWTARYVALEYFRSGAFVFALVYWSMVFWREEPPRRMFPPEMLKYLADMTDTMSYHRTKDRSEKPTRRQ